jgi:broad specificity phosphatase PhoE
MTRWTRRQLSALLVVALVVAPATVTAAPKEAGETLAGRVFASDLETPLAGVSVQLAPKGEQQLAAETVTDEAGRFAVEGLERGLYTVVLLDEQATPLAAAHVDLAQHQEIALALPEARPGEGAAAPAQQSQGGIKAWLSTPVGATVALVAGATVVALAADSLTDDNPEREDLPPVSESQPR